MITKATYLEVISNEMTYNLLTSTLNYTIIYSIYIQGHIFKTTKHKNEQATQLLTYPLGR